jgi:predicted small integral membrane protein
LCLCVLACLVEALGKDGWLNFSLIFHFSLITIHCKLSAMELSWTMRIRIVLAVAIGVVLLGILPWNQIKPGPEGIFALLSGNISRADLITCAILAFGAGFLASTVCTPFGMQIGVIAAPAGMAVWSFRSADLSTLFQASPAVNDRLAVYARLRFEAFIWLALAACCFLGAYVADKLIGKKNADLPDKFDATFKLPNFAIIPAAVIGTVIVANILINILAGDVRYSDPKMGQVTGQPANFQIAFAVIVAFMACGYVAKLFIGSSFIWPAAASALLSSYSIITYSNQSAITYLAKTWPAVFFIKPVTAVLPVQMVAFACLGAVWGYWLAVRYNLWKTYES